MIDIEVLIRRAWAEALPEASGDPQETFFTAGGTSLGAAIFVAKLREHGLDVPLETVFSDGRLSEILSETRRLTPNDDE